MAYHATSQVPPGCHSSSPTLAQAFVPPRPTLRRWEESVAAHEKSLATKRHIHGNKDHSDVAASLYSLAQVYQAQGRLDDSASLHEESLGPASNEYSWRARVVDKYSPDE